MAVNDDQLISLIESLGLEVPDDRLVLEHYRNTVSSVAFLIGLRSDQVNNQSIDFDPEILIGTEAKIDFRLKLARKVAEACGVDFDALVRRA